MDVNYFPLKEGDIVVNLGAHIGKHTQFFSGKVGETGRVIAIEPERTNYEKLVEATKTLANVKTFMYAIGEKTGEGCLNIGTNSESHSTVRTFYGKTQPTQIISWDDLVSQSHLNYVTLAKVDVEGAEIQWLKGMTHTFPKHVIMEEHSRFAYPLKELTDLLEEKGYNYKVKRGHIYATR